MREQPAASASPREVGAGSAHCPPLLARNAIPGLPAQPPSLTSTTPERSRGHGPWIHGEGVQCVTGVGTYLRPPPAYIQPHLNFNPLHSGLSSHDLRISPCYLVSLSPPLRVLAGPRPETSSGLFFFSLSFFTFNRRRVSASRNEQRQIQLGN